MRRLAAMSVRTSQCDCAVHPSPGISEILPPALTASLKVRSTCPASSPCLADEPKPVSTFRAICVLSALTAMCLTSDDFMACIHVLHEARQSLLWGKASALLLKARSEAGGILDTAKGSLHS